MRSESVVIVGGGVVGCAVALSCARAGLPVVLLERGAIAGETSSTGMGHLMVEPEREPLRSLTLASVRMWKRLHGELGAFALDAAGALWVVESESEAGALEAIEHGLSAAGVAAERLSRDALCAREPQLAADLGGGVFCAEDAVVVPMQATAALARAAAASGASIRTRSPVVAIERDGAGHVAAVRTPRERIAARAVVVAAGVWTPEVAALCGLHGVPIRPRRGVLAVTAPGSCPVRTQVLEAGYLAASRRAAVSDPDLHPGADAGSQALNVQPQARGTCLIGSTRRFSGIDRRIDRDLLDRSLARAVRFIPALAQARLVRTWAGLRPWTPDGLPFVGAVPGMPGLVLASGHEGLGLTLAPITGAIVARALAGEAAPPLEPALVAAARSLLPGEDRLALGAVTR